MLFVSLKKAKTEKKGSSMRSQAAHTARAANRRFEFEKELLSFILYAKLLVSLLFD